jgi:uncharacterized membrane protein
MIRVIRGKMVYDSLYSPRTSPPVYLSRKLKGGTFMAEEGEGGGGSGGVGVVAILAIFVIVILALVFVFRGRLFGGGGKQDIDVNISTPSSK